MMTRSVRKIVSSALMLAVAGASGLARAHDEMVSLYVNTTTPQNFFPSTDKVWTNRTTGVDTAVAWKSSDDYAVFPAATKTLYIQTHSAFSCYGYVNESAGGVNFTWQSFGVGAGGITLTQPNGGLTFSGDSGYTSPICTLKANQTWEGKNATGYAAVAIGNERNFHSPYTYSYISADSSVTDLTIKGRLAAMFYSPKNALGNVNVLVESPAELVMADATVTGTDAGQTAKRTLGKLNAKSVVFSGDGICARFGFASPYAERNLNKNPKTVSVIDTATLGKTVTLKDGADLVVTNATFALDTLYVTGSGTSTISGNTLTFTNDVTTFDIASGARLALAVSPKASPSTAKLAVTGSGTLELASDFQSGTLAGIDVPSGATLAITGGEPLSMPITGAGTVTVSPGDGNDVFIDDLTGFTGTVNVSSGTLYLNSVPTCPVTTSGTGAVNYDGTKYVGNQPVSAAEIKVSSGETLTVCGNGLTAATRVWLNGGTIQVVRDAVIASPVTQDVTSVWRADTGVTATFTGAVASYNAAGVESTISLYGGDIVFTGSVWTGGPSCDFALYAGNVTLRGATGTFGGRVGIPKGYTGKTMTFDGGTYEMCNVEAGDISEKGLHANVNGAKIVIANSARFEMKRTSNQVNFHDLVSSKSTTLDIDGGTLIVGHGRFDVRCSGTIILRNGGHLESRPFIALVENSSILDWRGGTLKAPSNLDQSYLFSGHWGTGSSAYAGQVKMSGDCVLNLSAIKAGKEIACSTTINGTEVRTPPHWVGVAGATLTVRGPGAVKFLDFTPNGMNLQLDEGADVRYPTLVSGFALGELLVNATNCAISTESTTVTPSIDTVRVGTNGVWSAGLLANFNSPTWTNMTVDDNGVLKFSPGDGVQTVPGTLTFGGNARTWIVPGKPSARGVVMTATGGIVGTPAWLRFGGLTRKVEISGNDVVIVPSGLIISLH